MKLFSTPLSQLTQLVTDSILALQFGITTSPKVTVDQHIRTSHSKLNVNVTLGLLSLKKKGKQGEFLDLLTIQA